MQSTGRQYSVASIEQVEEVDDILNAAVGVLAWMAADLPLGDLREVSWQLAKLIERGRCHLKAVVV